MQLSNKLMIVDNKFIKKLNEGLFEHQSLTTFNDSENTNSLCFVLRNTILSKQLEHFRIQLYTLEGIPEFSDSANYTNLAFGHF